MARRKAKKKGNVVTVDMSDVESGGLVPEGDHLATIKSASQETSESSGKDYIKWTCSTDKGPLYFNTSLQPQALFNLRGLLEALGQEIPEGPWDIDLDELVDMEFIAVVTHEKYEGKMRSRVDEYMAAEDDDGAEAEEGDEVESTGGDDLDMVSEEELGDMSVDELQAIVKKYDLDVKLSKFRSARKKLGAVSDALETEGYLED